MEVTRKGAVLWMSIEVIQAAATLLRNPDAERWQEKARECADALDETTQKLRESFDLFEPPWEKF
jgi:hypothetical protein